MNLASKKFLLKGLSSPWSWSVLSRYMSETKKFFNEARICHAEGGFEVNLDSRKLRTPTGSIITLPAEELAHAVATEWNLQQNVVKLNHMPLTSLCCAAMDASNERGKKSLVSSSLKYLATDTVLCHAADPPDLVEAQDETWQPLIGWFCKEFEVSVDPACSFTMPVVSPEAMSILSRHLLSLHSWAATGIEAMTGALKSLILALAVARRHTSVEDAVAASRLEQEFQISKWGRVEWHHDVELVDLRRKVAACALFVHSCTEDSCAPSATRYRRLS